MLRASRSTAARVEPLAGLLLVLLGACADPDANDGSGETSPDTSPDTGTGDTGSDDDGWRPVLQASPELGALMSVWGSSPAELFVVGGQPEGSGGGVVLRGHADEWTAETLPAATPMLNWVYGVDGGVWSVGEAGTIVRRGADGVWVGEASPTDETLWGLWGASAATLWAVGGDGVSGAPVLLRRDGDSATWTEVALPNLGVDAHALFKVWGFAADDVWVVGDAGASLHWDGQAWTAAPDLDGVDLISVWGSDGGAVVAVGGRANARVDRLVDGAWVGQTLAAPGLNGVWVDADGAATVVGVQGSIHTIAPASGSGSGSSVELETQDSGTAMVLHAVFGFTGGPRYAVGGSLLMAPPFQGVIVMHD